MNGNIYNTSTAAFTDEEVKITWKEGPLVPKLENGTKATQTVLPLSFPPSGECEWCEFICDAIIGGGCGLTGAIRCALICAGNPVCSGICGVAWFIVCQIGSAAADCEANCISWGYCD